MKHYFQIVRLDLGTFYATSSFKSTYKPFCIWTMQLPQFGIDNPSKWFLSKLGNMIWVLVVMHRNFAENHWNE